MDVNILEEKTYMDIDWYITHDEESLSIKHIYGGVKTILDSI